MHMQKFWRCRWRWSSFHFFTSQHFWVHSLSALSYVTYWKWTYLTIFEWIKNKTKFLIKYMHFYGFLCDFSYFDYYYVPAVSCRDVPKYQCLSQCKLASGLAQGANFRGCTILLVISRKNWRYFSVFSAKKTGGVQAPCASPFCRAWVNF